MRETALLIDMQNCFVENSPVAAPRGREICRGSTSSPRSAASAARCVIHTAASCAAGRQQHRRDGGDHSCVAAGLINKGNKQAELHPEIIVGKHDIVLEKPRYGAFHGTDLDLILRNRGIDTVIVTGICTNVCCERPRAKPI